MRYVIFSALVLFYLYWTVGAVHDLIVLKKESKLWIHETMRITWVISHIVAILVTLTYKFW